MLVTLVSAELNAGIGSVPNADSSSGEPADVQLRACAVHATELALAALRDRGVALTAPGLHHRLWRIGQDPAEKAVPSHRCRCTYC